MEIAQRAMTVNGLLVKVHTPPAPEGEEINPLPDYSPTKVYPVSAFPNVPSTWHKGGSRRSAYFMEFLPKKHLWLDFNNNWNFIYELGILIEVQGVNPLTGKAADTELKKYYHCPEHGVPLQTENYCPACKYFWPYQNYMSTTCWPHGKLWLDGYYNNRNSVRGFLSSSFKQSVAGQLFEKEIPPDIKITFFCSKELKPQKPLPAKQYSIAGVTMGIAAGAPIEQKLTYNDPRGVDFYRMEPWGTLELHLLNSSDFEKVSFTTPPDILSEGPLSKMRVGNP